MIESILLVMAIAAALGTGERRPAAPPFQTSDRCIACHNGLVTASGEDVSIGFDWRATIMANSSRDPYWQASVRREVIDHPGSQAMVEDTCATCHMPMSRYAAKLRGSRGQVFAHLPFAARGASARTAEDGVSCSLCHQIGKERLGTAESFNGGFVIDSPTGDGIRPEYGPFQIDAGHARVMHSSSEAFRPLQSDHLSRSEMCATCHTLYTETLGPGGAVIGRFPEQVPFQEWLHSDFKDVRSCQSCHMPPVDEDVPITRVFGQPRPGVSRHVFVAANFFILKMLDRYRGDLHVAALPQELSAASDRTIRYLGTEAARLSIENMAAGSGRLRADIVVENLGGHKLPTAYPSRRTWLHIVVRDREGAVAFESGAVHADGSIEGNDNDEDPSRFEPHRSEIGRQGDVQIYETILADSRGAVTTGLLSAARYLKDNRLLPRGFDKRTADADVAVHGGAADDPDFGGGSDRVSLSVPVDDGRGPFQLDVELLYQPIAFRWANNLKRYGDAAEPARFTTYYDAMGSLTTATLARASRAY